MPTQQDMQIFITGVVGRAMGSGKFDAADIITLAENAKAAFETVLGAPTEHAPPQRAPQPIQRPASPQGHPGHVGTVARQVVAAAAAGGNSVQPAPEHSFGRWCTHKAYYGKKEWMAWGKPWPEVTWDELLQHASAGDEKALKALNHMANGTPRPEYDEKDRRKIANARCVLNMARKLQAQGGEPDLSEVGNDETPF